MTVDGRAVELTSKEFDLLACFLEHPGIVLSRERLLDLVWGMTYPGGTRTVDVHVAQLRAQARRPGGDPHRARGRLQAHRRLSMRGTSLRSRLFQAIGIVVLICVALTIGLGLASHAPRGERATLHDVAHQVDSDRANAEVSRSDALQT